MEPAALLQMVSNCAETRNFVTDWVISDDDSSICTVTQHPDPTKQNDKGKLPTHIPVPQFMADPSHRIKVVSKYFYKLKNLPVSQSRVDGAIASRLKRSWGYMIKQNRGGSLEQMIRAAKAPLDHIFNDHKYCGDWCLAVKAKKQGKIYNNPRGWLCKEKNKKEYNQIHEIVSKYGDRFFLKQSLHPFDTQTNEALNQAQACLTPKSKVFHSSRSFHYRHAINP